MRTIALAAFAAVSIVLTARAQPAAPKPAMPAGPLVFEAEAWSTPTDAWVKDKPGLEGKWNLWSTDADAQKKWSGGVVLQSTAVKEDRRTHEEGAPPLHTHSPRAAGQR